MNNDTRPILTAKEIMEHKEIIQAIDAMVYEALKVRNSINPSEFNDKLNYIKGKFLLSEAQNNAVESFYDMWFNTMVSFNHMNKPAPLQYISDIVFEMLKNHA